MKKSKLQSAFHELKKNPPSVLKETMKKKGSPAANKQRIAIAFSKARQAEHNKIKGKMKDKQADY